jgi:hypothetical protein
MTAEILTSTIFTNYGGKTGTSTAFALNAAFEIAEHEMSSHLHTLLVPANVSGTYLNQGNPFEMDYGYVHAILGINIVAAYHEIYTYSATDLSHHVYIRNSKYGQVDIGLGACSPCSSYPSAYQVNVYYNAGLPSVISSAPDFLWALTMAAQLVLNEMSTDGFLANETPGGIGVESFSNELYSEKRVPLGTTVFGSSPVAQQIARIVNQYRCRTVGRFRR